MTSLVSVIIPLIPKYLMRAMHADELFFSRVE
jgi:hypothetical protein